MAGKVKCIPHKNPDIADFNNGGGGGGDKPSNNFVWKENPKTNKLELWNNENFVSSMGYHGSNFSESVATGVGSFHLGSIHDIGSCGRAVVFRSNMTSSSMLPLIHRLSEDGGTIEDAYKCSFGDLTYIEPFGKVDKTQGVVKSAFLFTAPTEMVVFGISIVPAEDYEGEMFAVLSDSLTGQEIYRVRVDVCLVDGKQTSVTLHYPIFADVGREVRMSFDKVDGGALLCYRANDGVNVSDMPYIKLKYRTYTKEKVASINDLGDTVTVNFLESGAPIPDHVYAFDADGSKQTIELYKINDRGSIKFRGTIPSGCTWTLGWNKVMDDGSCPLIRSKKVFFSGSNSYHTAMVSGQTWSPEDAPLEPIITINSSCDGALEKLVLGSEPKPPDPGSPIAADYIVSRKRWVSTKDHYWYYETLWASGFMEVDGFLTWNPDNANRMIHEFIDIELSRVVADKGNGAYASAQLIQYTGGETCAPFDARGELQCCDVLCIADTFITISATMTRKDLFTKWGSFRFSMMTLKRDGEPTTIAVDPKHSWTSSNPARPDTKPAETDRCHISVADVPWFGQNKHVWNAGDVVIASNNAYVCVLDGTTNAPEASDEYIRFALEVNPTEDVSIDHADVPVTIWNRIEPKQSVVCRGVRYAINGRCPSGDFKVVASLWSIVDEAKGILKLVAYGPPTGSSSDVISLQDAPIPGDNWMWQGQSYYIGITTVTAADGAIADRVRPAKADDTASMDNPYFNSTVSVADGKTNPQLWLFHTGEPSFTTGATVSQFTGNGGVNPIKNMVLYPVVGYQQNWSKVISAVNYDSIYGSTGACSKLAYGQTGWNNDKSLVWQADLALTSYSKRQPECIEAWSRPACPQGEDAWNYTEPWKKDARMMDAITAIFSPIPTRDGLVMKADRDYKFRIRFSADGPYASPFMEYATDVAAEGRTFNISRVGSSDLIYSTYMPNNLRNVISFDASKCGTIATGDTFDLEMRAVWYFGQAKDAMLTHMFIRELLCDPWRSPLEPEPMHCVTDDPPSHAPNYTGQMLMGDTGLWVGVPGGNWRRIDFKIP